MVKGRIKKGAVLLCCVLEEIALTGAFAWLKGKSRETRKLSNQTVLQNPDKHFESCSTSGEYGNDVLTFTL